MPKNKPGNKERIGEETSCRKTKNEVFSILLYIYFKIFERS